MAALGTHFELTPREAQKVFASVSLFYASLPKDSFSNEFLVSFLAVLRVRLPELYTKVRDAELNAAALINETKLVQRVSNGAGNFRWEYAKSMVRFFSISQHELDSAINEPSPDEEMKMLRFAYQGSLHCRLRILPELCSRLDQFSFQPTNSTS